CLKPSETGRALAALTRSPDKVLHRFETTVLKPSETGRAWAALTRSPDTVLHHSETTGGHAEAVGDGPRLSSTDALTGQGVAPFGNNRRPC
ncbi:MAG: hypothetical protein LBD24_02375, partial [Spirochaetaceae bacterium]|nr:hypothetical protein [Spirochaetaceae bacterium]